jgi:hypothetical protein
MEWGSVVFKKLIKEVRAGARINLQNDKMGKNPLDKKIYRVVIGQTVERMLQWHHIKSKITTKFALGTT